MNDHNELKAKRKKALLAQLESKKKDLQRHFGDTANKSIEVGKGLLAIGAGVLLLHTIFDRFLEAKFKPINNKKEGVSSKASTNKLLYPLFTMLLQQGSSILFDQGQKQLVDYLENKKQTNERLPTGISSK